METDLMLWIHSQSRAVLDGAAWVGWALGVLRLVAPALLAVVLWHLHRGERREALAWLVVGVMAAVLPELLKAVVARPRPTLWPWLIPTTGFSFPSGHATAGTALYPLAGWVVLRHRGLGPAGYLLGLLVGVFVGLSRLYVGVHWPTDVLGGWTLGTALSLGAVGWLGRSTTLTASPGSSKVTGLGKSGNT